MNSYYRIINFLKDSLQADQDVNTITHGAVNDIDIEKKNIFPIAHLEVLGAAFPDGLVQVNFKIHVLDQRMVSKQPITDKFRKNDNEIDVLNTTLAVINRLIRTLKSQHNDDDVLLLNEPTPQPVQFDFTNTLDGWEVDLELAVTNTIAVC